MGLNLAPVAAREGWGEPGGVRLSARVEESPATSSGVPPAYRPTPSSCPLRTASETEWFRVALPQPHVCLGRMKSCGWFPCVFSWFACISDPSRSRRGERMSFINASRSCEWARRVGGAPLSSVPRVTTLVS
jgi:hypothetical protein